MTIDNPLNWEIIYSDQHSKSPVEEDIGRILIPGTFTQHIIRIYCTSSVAKSRWWLAGNLSHLLGSNSQPDFEGSNWRVPLNKIMLIQLPELTTNYRLKFEVARWHKEIAIVIETYVGG